MRTVLTLALLLGPPACLAAQTEQQFATLDSALASVIREANPLGENAVELYFSLQCSEDRPSCTDRPVAEAVRASATALGARVLEPGVQAPPRCPWHAADPATSSGLRFILGSNR